MEVFFPSVLAVLLLVFAGFSARRRWSLFLSGVIASLLFLIQDVILRALIGWGEAWSSDSGPKPVLTWLEVGGVAALVMYFVLG